MEGETMGDEMMGSAIWTGWSSSLVFEKGREEAGIGESALECVDGI